MNSNEPFVNLRLQHANIPPQSAFIAQELEEIRAAGLYRAPRRVDSACGNRIVIDGRAVDNFCSNDYLGLAGDPRVIAAAARAAEKYGAGAGAARLICGNHALFEELETALADFKQTEAALVFSSGYLANLGVVSALAGKGDAVILDRLAHASLIDAARLCGASLKVFPHNDMNALEAVLRRAAHCRRRLIAVDGVYSMDGDLALLREIAGLAEKYGALVLVDDAHGTGVVGEQGRGALALARLRSPLIVQMGTLSKALGSLGGFIAGERALIELLINRSRPFIFDTALPASAVGAALASLEILRSEPQRLSDLWRNIERTRCIAGQLDLPEWPAQSAILPIVIGDETRTMNAAKALFDKGLLISGIRPPAVKKGASRLRLTLMATHTPEQMACLESTLTELRSHELI